MSLPKPTRAQLEAAAGKTIPDALAPGLIVLFCGINPGLYSGYLGHHFARPGNRFWTTLHAAGFTPRLLRPEEDRELLQFGFGLTNLVARATAAANELTDAELVAGREVLAEKVATYRPRVVAVLGISAYRKAFKNRAAQLGQQRESLEGSELWVLPNPSGLNAHYTPAALSDVYRDFLSQIRL